MELIVLNVGLVWGVLSPTLFAMLVIMAIATTVATTPVLYALTEASERAGMAPAFRRPELDKRPGGSALLGSPAGARRAINGQDSV
jgi:hypothetical protein